MENWTVEEVGQFLRENDFDEEVIEIFRENKIMGRVMAHLSDSDLKELGIRALGDRRYLTLLIQTKSHSENDSNNVKCDVDQDIEEVTNKKSENNPPKHDVGQDDDGQDNDEITDETWEDDDFENFEGHSKSRHLQTEELTVHPNVKASSMPSQQGPIMQSAAAELSKQPGQIMARPVPQIIVIPDDNEMAEIPEPFPFPATYGTNIDVALLTGKMCVSTQSKFYTVISNIMANYKRLPCGRDYERVAQAVLQKYPFMKNDISKKGSPYGHIVTALQNRFREKRRYKSNNKSVLVRRERDTNKNNAKRIKLEDSKLKIPEGEDDASFNRHNNALKAEFKKVKPNRAIVTTLMQQSFTMRRNSILEQPRPLSELLQMYPFLGDPDEMIAELCRVTGSGDQLKTQFIDTWEHQWLPKLSVAIKDNISKTNLKRLNSLIDIEKDLDDTCAAELTIRVMYVLALILKDHKAQPVAEKLLSFIPATVNIDKAAAEVSSVAPCILVVGQLKKINETFLIVEKKVICMVKPILCPLLLLAAYYSYNMTYPTGLNTLYTFLEYVVLDLKPKKMPSALAQFTTYLSAI